jgi:sugar lactone lactonase YvrE
VIFRAASRAGARTRRRRGSVGAERCANLCFGGRKRNRLFMAASQSVYSVYVNTQGVAGG